ncbi:putative epoxide hydrolase-like protein [Hapsidospora chrysogenum ATCC 11550]|uniref:Putative epoxide hydrolase-like protein n=1 Tax=Hapsidospora chrysogenum (strain ATCC 11550 / CBS 779.69 / DSM 880 / IAM 14645 / JCM 23072 / IMI 49137) TaxID=857340 RepID=A0A086TBD8_HAPC1|nr:putative epoxide hydrolase-like protein [Hapsidospora chrysogenum ATCC 11550]
MATPAPTAEAAVSQEEVKPYKIHVSSKYLDLTRQKLELTRLPHENPEPKSRDWWEPKPIVESLIDFWLEHYSWRDEETRLNATVPQFRTSLLVPGTESTAVRLHFVHAPSPHSNAVPLLLIPPFPFTNLSLAHIIRPFTDPEDATTNQPFHLVMPSLPGLGFSDALPKNTPTISATVEMLDALMRRLGYRHYITTHPGPSASSPSQIDWKLVDALARNYQDSCLGAHFISPPWRAPKIQESPLDWARWRVADTLQKPAFGYSQEDLVAWQRAKHSRRDRLDRDPRPEEFAFDGNGFREPNTLSYALCDSPIGLLLFVLMVLRVLGPDKELTPQELITLTELTWLPGPEEMLRFWANCGSAEEDRQQQQQQHQPPAGRRPKIAITTFTGDDGKGVLSIAPRPAAHFYACPGWGKARYDTVATQRVAGKPGLLAWERPEVILSGTRGLAKAILAGDKRLLQTSAGALATAPLQQGAIVDGGGLGDAHAAANASARGTTVREAAGSQSEAAPTIRKPAPGPLGAGPSSQRPAAAQRQPLVMDKMTVGRISEDQEDDQEPSPDTVVAVGHGVAPGPALVPQIRVG